MTISIPNAILLYILLCYDKFYFFSCHDLLKDHLSRNYWVAKESRKCASNALTPWPCLLLNFKITRDKIRESMIHNFSKSHGEKMTCKFPYLFFGLIRNRHRKFALSWPWKIHCLFFFQPITPGGLLIFIFFYWD